ncbi:MAG: acyltransferase family protein, partial [Saccharothrix sp.]|nr:acyltransferase family protein [Saccharothrix sp.]
MDGRSSLSGREPAGKTRIAFIDIGRGLAALLVFYSHLAEQWIAKREAGPTPVIDVVDAVTSDPMRMGLQGIGQVAVPFFFLVSGYVVTPVALRQGARGFGLNRLVRVYVPMTFVVLLTAAVILLGAEPLGGGKEPVITWWTVVTNALTINYLLVPQVVMVGVAWTLVVEVIFYILLVVLLPLVRRAPWLAISIQLVFIFVVMMTNRQFGASWFVFAVNVSYLAIPLIGQIIWATTTKRVPLWLGGVFAGAAWALYVLADHLKFGRLDASYSLALAVAVLCFLMGMFAEPRLVERRLWVGLSERSYSIYLLHGLVAFVVLDLLRPQVPLWLAMPIAVAVTFGVVEVSYRYVEKPSHVLARRLARGPAPKPDPELSEEIEEIEDVVELEPELDPADEPAPARERRVREEPTEVLRPVRPNRPRPPRRTTPEPTSLEPTTSEPATSGRPPRDRRAPDRPVPERPVPDRATLDRPLPDRPRLDRQVPDQPVPERPRLDRPVSDRPLPDRQRLDRQVPDQPVAERPRPDRPVPDQPVLDRPRPERPVSDRPVAERPRPDRPVPERPPLDGPVPDRPRPERSRPDRPVPDRPIGRPRADRSVPDWPEFEQPESDHVPS